ncbi:hypothetical protein EXIGLDRAFT_747903 [Exidia glandulosa HHB12029]|uniref:SNF2 family DNA-dependent ATPase domain-containing protein n=1 Tax=Exidia glandulosa HHB12029 TaxID=1314781 RepID=A0A165K886_EXIGL|nr:hypothetical protein EXIGLDRAFT_747903 [Exidia glandulosa HHB12029]
MAHKHTLEYAKSNRAKCHGNCKGIIAKGDLRMGTLVPNHFGNGAETYQWRHWGCIPKAVLNNFKRTQIDRVSGFRQLRHDDQQRVRNDVARGAVGPVALPAQQPQPSSSQKRKHDAVDNTPVIEIDDDEEVAGNVEDEVVEEHYVTMRTEIVGVQYYTGMVGMNERVMVLREPTNNFDRNAVKVWNAAHVGVGHLPRALAASLAPLMDRNQITVEGVVLKASIGKQFTLPVDVKIYGRSDQRHILEPLLVFATPNRRGFTEAMRTAEYTGNPRRGPQAASSSQYAAAAAYAGSSQVASSSKAGGTSAAAAASQAAAAKRLEEYQKAQELRSILETLGKVDDEGRRGGLMDKIMDEGDVLKLPELEDERKPTGLRVELMKHQSQALRWCLEKENPVLPTKESDRAVQFWQFKKEGNKPYWYNWAAMMPMQTPPVLGRGGLIADAMGLGKTLTILALVLATKGEPKGQYSGATLVVCPLSVLSNWEKQTDDHVQHGKLKFITYYGSGRDASVETLEKADVVLTTYQVVQQDWQQHVQANSGLDPGAGTSRKKKKSDGGLAAVKWKRVVLDEGHTIRNAKTKAAEAVRGLTAERRWVVTGTPIINSPKDLGSILQFLRVCAPLDQEDFFKSILLRPLTAGNPKGVEVLKGVMTQICLRRTKEMQDDDGKHLVDLPPVEMTVVTVTLPDETRKLYDEIEELSAQRFEDYMERARREALQGNFMASANVLGMLTRMRQLVLHPGLIPRNYIEVLRAGRIGGTVDPAVEREPQVQVSAKDKVRLQALLAQAIEENEECPICFDVLTDPRITACAHSFCLACIMQVIQKDNRCPMDRRTLGVQDLIEPAPPTEATQRWAGDEEDDDDETDGIRAGSSAKIDQLIKLLKLTPGNEKSLVFSQFTGFLDKIGDALNDAGIMYVRLDGKMSAKRREEVIRQFSVPLPNAHAAKKPKVASPHKPSAASSSSSRRPSRAAATTGRARASKMVIPDSDDMDFDARVEADDDDDYNHADEDAPMSDGGGFFSDDSDDDFKGKGKAKAKGKGRAGRSLTEALSSADGNPPVMLISLKAGALGLNLTVANNVYLMDPWWQEGIESQAIDRCNRIGQTKTVHVYQMVAENTIEAKVLAIQERKKNLIKQAFSGIKSRETERQKREARMNDLIELFGIRSRQEEAERAAAAS